MAEYRKGPCVRGQQGTMRIYGEMSLEKGVMAGARCHWTTGYRKRDSGYVGWRE